MVPITPQNQNTARRLKSPQASASFSYVNLEKARQHLHKQAAARHQAKPRPTAGQNSPLSNILWCPPKGNPMFPLIYALWGLYLLWILYIYVLHILVSSSILSTIPTTPLTPAKTTDRDLAVLPNLPLSLNLPVHPQNHHRAFPPSGVVVSSQPLTWPMFYPPVTPRLPTDPPATDREM